jgi:zinc protease
MPLSEPVAEELMSMNVRKHVASGILFLIVWLSSSPLQALDVNVKTHTLKNGLKMLLLEDHSIPNVALYIFYRVGSRNERPGITGLAHFFEHMMFNGAKKYGPKQFDIVMETNGGSNNAYTTNNVTVYQDWFPTSALELIFDMEADRMQHLSFDPQMVESERGVVASERRTSVEANNYGLLNEQLWAVAYTAHPYQWPVIGWMVDIENWKIEDLKAYYKMGYAPNNATLVITGDFEAKRVIELAEKYLGPIPSSDPPPPIHTREPEQQGERRVELRKFAQLPVVMLGYHIPETSHPDFYPLRLLETILFDGQSSRLYQRLVDKEQVALWVQGGFDFAFDPTLFEITVQPKDDVETATIEKLLYEELDRAKNALVANEELQKAKNIHIANFYRAMKTISGKANTIGTYEVFFGDYRKLFTATDEFNKVTREDLQRVARQYFTPKNRTVATLVPEPSEEKASK